MTDLYDFDADGEDEVWMRTALQLAESAYEQQEVPVAAVIVNQGELIGQGWNRPISSHDPTAHAEILAIRDATQRQQNYRLPGATMYVTLEPCAMCLGAMIHARISRLVYGAFEPKAGAIASHTSILENHPFNWKIETHGGVLADDCRALLQQFFKQRRDEAKGLKKTAP